MIRSKILIALACYFSSQLLGTCLFIRDADGLSAQEHQGIINEEAITTAYTKFLETPTSENARAFAALLPQKKLKDRSRQIDSIERILELVIDSGDNYFILEKETYAGNCNAVDAIFRLLNFSDGSVSEALFATIGSLIRINPRLFISKLNAYCEQNLTDDEVGRYVAGVEVFYFDRPSALIHEYEMRIQALEWITDDKFLNIRKACINSLRQRIQRLKNN